MLRALVFLPTLKLALENILLKPPPVRLLFRLAWLDFEFASICATSSFARASLVGVRGGKFGFVLGKGERPRLRFGLREGESWTALELIGDRAEDGLGVVAREGWRLAISRA